MRRDNLDNVLSNQVSDIGTCMEGGNGLVMGRKGCFNGSETERGCFQGSNAICRNLNEMKGNLKDCCSGCVRVLALAMALVLVGSSHTFLKPTPKSDIAIRLCVASWLILD